MLVSSPAERVLLLAPSNGLGGGIERYLSTVQAAFDQYGVPYRRIDLTWPGNHNGPQAKLRFVREVTHALRTSIGPVQLIFAHNNLLPVLRIVAPMRHFAGATAILYGREIWSARRPRGWRTMRRSDVRVITISQFSAGALAQACQTNVNVLQPGISLDWYQSLVEAGGRTRSPSDHIELISVFRLLEWRVKGLDTLLDAIELLGDNRIRLTVCGSGPIPADLAAAVAGRTWCRIAADLADEVLAEQLAAADLCVLATRTRYGKGSCGEGFGLVLVEAQLAGTPVVAPAYGGSWDTFQHGLTGLAPTDESPEALARVLATLLYDQQRLTEMGHAATAWARARFEPCGYAPFAIETLLGLPAPLTTHTRDIVPVRSNHPVERFTDDLETDAMTDR
jgi:phosphatidylinositol alpha-1,6-mannosyltransferase